MVGASTLMSWPIAVSRKDNASLGLNSSEARPP
jgi:hypothetical protein